ncbi:MGMT family protein [Aminipila butyrica]|uniref:MGMT family protein n=1 Tax=Aminipila butyrica TaxID=433296 RepID=A0A858BS12_9FIRM|nr:MGMT family protein [Aminipila butyrica]QIB68741.1 MGMT family protein [Aminipila butyrica]
MDNATFYEAIYEIVAEIPAGSVATYGQIAWMAGSPKAPRMVGYAMSHVPAGANLPCHRVVNRLGEMAPYHVFGGETFQRQLLEQEGVSFLENGRIDMKKCQWRLYGSPEAMDK